MVWFGDCESFAVFRYALVLLCTRFALYSYTFGFMGNGWVVLQIMRGRVRDDRDTGQVRTRGMPSSDKIGRRRRSRYCEMILYYTSAREEI